MTQNQQHLIELLKGHLRGDLSPADQQELDTWVARSESNRRLFASIDDEEQLRSLIMQYHQEETENNEELIFSKIKLGLGLGGSTYQAPVRELQTGWSLGWVAAAAVIIVTAAGAYWLMNSKTSRPESTANTATVIEPGKDGAILTLADGSKVLLDSMGNGIIANQNGSQVMLKNGTLSYSGNNATSSVHNHLSTPKGRQFKLSLPDGTKVWLNAASSISYPTAFDGNQRRVAVTGEAYFEIAQNQHQPFSIDVNQKAEIRVLGTEFNINAYTDEPNIRATLIDGNIQIRPGAIDQVSSFVSLKPGQQASISQQGNETFKQPVELVKDANIQKVVAWKNGYFNFDGLSLREVMRQIERWYDVEVEFEEGVPDQTFGGGMGRDMSLEGFFKSLKDNDVNFRVEGRKIIVLP